MPVTTRTMTRDMKQKEEAAAQKQWFSKSTKQRLKKALLVSSIAAAIGTAFQTGAIANLVDKATPYVAPALKSLSETLSPYTSQASHWFSTNVMPHLPKAGLLGTGATAVAALVKVSTWIKAKLTAAAPTASKGANKQAKQVAKKKATRKPDATSQFLKDVNKLNKAPMVSTGMRTRHQQKAKQGQDKQETAVPSRTSPRLTAA